MLDTTHPAAIRRAAETLDFDATLFIVASKSGTTLETRCHLDFFWERAGKRGEFFAAITDPGSELEQLAKERGFRASFDGEPTIGGRYSALSVFGLVPAALMGVDLERLLERVEETVEACHGEEGNPGLELGLELGNGWAEGRDKVTINPNPGGFGLWAEQLLAESTGKDGKGLIPAPEESPDGPDRQAPEVRLPAPYELGQEFYRWEFATAVAGSILGINPFDQPNVQAAKDKTNEVLRRAASPTSSRAARSRSCSRRRGRATTSRCRRSSTPSARPSWSRCSRAPARRPAASSPTASGRATCTRPASCTRAGRTPGSSSRSSTTPATSCRSRAATSASGG